MRGRRGRRLGAGGGSRGRRRRLRRWPGERKTVDAGGGRRFRFRRRTRLGAGRGDREEDGETRMQPGERKAADAEHRARDPGREGPVRPGVHPPAGPSRPSLFVADRAAAHRALVQRGAAFAGRPPAALPGAVFSSGQRTVTSAAYGPLWTALRSNLAAKTLHPSRLRGGFAAARRRAVAGLVDAIAGLVDAHRRGSNMMCAEMGWSSWRARCTGAVVQVTVAMCFGEGVVEEPAVVAAIEAAQREFATTVIGFQCWACGRR
ncbi:hypothetical protein PR202_ga30712 [Eleusine coracana subsp. coracana]|uniref:Uncharacterized protein n=1 Tax=Eleusine coracana subsp. coracana TaxID=191504 RepID=A0AAV5DN37_ELECO|nr:hypothetical protein PR202_ga30712 [Eleusine coracana subsp. coracana]